MNNVSRWILTVAALHAVGWSPVCAQRSTPTPIQIDDLYRHDAATDLVVTPDGRRGIYVRDWAERGRLFRRQALWHIERAADRTKRTGTPASPVRRPLEAGELDGRRPVLSPDGKWLAFLSARPYTDGSPVFPPVPIWSEPAMGIWLMPLDGGKAIPLAGRDKPYGRVFNDPFYGRLAFSPNGKQLVFVADEGADVRSPAEREIDITVVREDQGEGYEGYGPAAVWAADLAQPPGEYAATRIRRLTQDGYWYGDPQWTPDGRSVIVHANRTADRESVRFSINKNYDLWRIDVESGQLVALTSGPGPQVSPRIAPDGKRLVCLSVPRRGPHNDVYNLELVDLSPPAAGTMPVSRVLYDHHAVGDATAPHGVPVFPLAADCWQDNRWFVIDTVAGMAAQKQLIDADSPHGQADQEGPAGHATFRRQTEARGHLTPPSNEYLGERLVAVDQVVRWKSTDGLEIDGVLTLPPAPVARAPYKLLLYPHGGPHSRAAPGFNFTVQLFAAQGFAVFQPNFRGTSGYGKRFLDADRFDLGGGDMHDILTGIDQLVRDGIVDPRRQFVYGISYGGFMTCWLIGHTQQFRAAAPQNAVTEMNTMWGVGDLPSWTQWELGGAPWEIPGKMRHHSPFSYVHRVRTPTLVLHADHDRRCPLPMGQMFFRGLQAVGVESEMVIYHNERHGIVQLPHQEDIYRRVLAWFARHDLDDKPAAGR